MYKKTTTKTTRFKAYFLTFASLEVKYIRLACSPSAKQEQVGEKLIKRVTHHMVIGSKSKKFVQALSKDKLMTHVGDK